MNNDLYDRIAGSLTLAGMGDALGAATEQWSMDEIEVQHGGLVRHFVHPPEDTFAGASGGRRAEVTDDASQLYYLAMELIATDGSLTAERWNSCFLRWANACPKAAILGQNTAEIVGALRAGSNANLVGVIGRSSRKMTSVGTSNGAAIRIAPVGLMHPGYIEAACLQALKLCGPTHDTDVAASAACAVASATSQALVTDTLNDVWDAAKAGAHFGTVACGTSMRRVAGAKFLPRLQLALHIAQDACNDRQFMRCMEQWVGTSIHAAESVPAAFGVVMYTQADPARTIQIAASMGNDTDSMATIAGAIAGAFRGFHTLPFSLKDEFLRANAADFDLSAMASGLSRLATRHCPTSTRTRSVSTREAA